MTSKEALKELYSYSMLDDDIAKQNVEIIKKDLEVLEIIKKNPELVLWCCCYENATQMVLDRRSFRLKDNVNEIIENFNKVKEWLENE